MLAWQLLAVLDGGGWNIVAGNVKEVGDRVVDGNETLKMSR
jgi:hypothetical protein